MATLRIIRNVLAILGVFLIGLIIYTKFVGASHWNKETGVDRVQHFTKAYIYMLDGSTRVVNVRSWRDYEFSDQIQITTTSGVTYLTHASRLILTDECH